MCCLGVQLNVGKEYDLQNVMLELLIHCFEILPFSVNLFVLILVLHSKSELAIFGASMAGACFGFLLHNRYKASVFMGDTGSLALGGALAAMAACSGMFLPLFISSGIFFLDASSVIMQVYINVDTDI